MKTKELLQETLEEAAKKQWGNVHRTGVLGFIEGAKWQQGQDKNKYSEEDLREAIVKSALSNIDSMIERCDEIIEQFKKK